MPTTKEGTCPWCGRHNVTLYLATGVDIEIGFWIDWICSKCMEAAQKLRDERSDNND